MVSRERTTESREALAVAQTKLADELEAMLQADPRVAVLQGQRIDVRRRLGEIRKHMADIKRSESPGSN